MPTYTGSSMVGVCFTAVVTIATAIWARSATTAATTSHRRCRPGPAAHRPFGPPTVLVTLSITPAHRIATDASADAPPHRASAGKLERTPQSEPWHPGVVLAVGVHPQRVLAQGFGDFCPVCSSDRGRLSTTAPSALRRK
ncbi:hypothetical protein GCM10009680_33960 [Streptomyces yatensis]|uniref:Secreted protein n=1 Tax=Streptomyces yatensis TaxID=155177 RepID=A0ABN2HQC9_9ACTN